MKKQSALLLAVFLLPALSPAQTLRSSVAEKIIPGSELVYFNEQSHLPALIRLKPGASGFVHGAYAVTVMKSLLGVSGDHNLKAVKEEFDDLGFTHIRSQQYYKGIPVEAGTYIAHVRENSLVSMNGVIFPVEGVNTVPALTEKTALQKALAFTGAKKYKWENTEEVNFLREFFYDPAFTYEPKGELVIFPSNGEFHKDSNFRLAWKFDIYAEVPESRNHIYVDAVNGAVIGKLEQIHAADVQGTAATKYSGTQTITTDQVSSTSYRLRETGRGKGIETWNAKTGTSTSSAVDFTDSDNTWNNVNSAKDEAAPDAHFATEKTYDYFLTIHNRNSIDNNGFKLLNYVHWDVNWYNASWNGQYMRYGDGNGSPLTTMDIGAHEMTHGLTSNSAKLVYQNESGALNESFSDIFGTCVEFYAKSSTANWTIAEELGSAFRSMSNPKAKTDPDTYKGQYWVTGTSDNGGVHTNSGVQNHWFYLLSVGGSGVNDNSENYTVTGIGISKAEKIAFRNLTVYLTSSSTYADARTYSLESAKDIFGDCSQEHLETANAWYAVGVGQPISNCAPQPPAADFTSDVTSTCTGKINFTDKSANKPTSWLWEFGDGATSTQQHPAHTYTSNGTYSVTLTAANSVGNDSVIKTSYITVNAPAPPVTQGDSSCGPGVVNLSASGSNTLNWYDASSGGTMVNTGTTYSPSLTTTTTFYVENAAVPAPAFFAPKDSALGSGGYFTANADRRMYFNVLKPLTIKTVKVYANTAGSRTIEVLDQNGTTYKTITVNIPAGMSRVALNFDMAPGSQYAIKISGTLVDLYRNSAGAGYPYSISGLISITGTDASSAGYYYFFYDWEVQEESCISARVPVTGTINVCTGVDPGALSSGLEIYPNPVAHTLHFSYPVSAADTEKIKVELVNALGEIVFTADIKSSSVQRFDVASLPAGIYLLRISGGGETLVRKIVKV
jgi:Zn-dependent metalloprotease